MYNSWAANITEFAFTITLPYVNPFKIRKEIPIVKERNKLRVCNLFLNTFFIITIKFWSGSRV